MVTQTTNSVTKDVAFAVTKSGVIVLWNDSAERVLGYPASTAIGQHCWELLSGQDIYGNPYCSEHCSIREMAFQRYSVNNYQASFKTNSKKRRLFSINCLLVFSEAGNDLLLHLCHLQTGETQRRCGNYDVNTNAGKPGEPLTRREQEVLNFLADGKSTRQIASAMSISTSTVRNHIQHVLKKLNVHTRFDAIMLGKHLSRI